MAKESGIVAVMAVDDSGGSVRTISNDITDFSISTPRAMITVTGLDKLAEERLQGLADMSITLNGVFNDGTNAAHDVSKKVILPLRYFAQLMINSLLWKTNARTKMGP